MRLRERPRAPAAQALALPPALLPDLRKALARRAEAFGPWDGDEPEPAPRGILAAIGAALRGIGDLLDPPRAVTL